MKTKYYCYYVGGDHDGEVFYVSTVALRAILHARAEMRRLEAEYPDEFVTVSVEDSHGSIVMDR